MALTIAGIAWLVFYFNGLALGWSSSSEASASATSVYVEPGVPTGVPISGNYTGQYRPQVHFSPPHGFMNDPNGLHVDKNGTWHLYYQYNPTGLVAGNQHWGHATSPDLYHWTNQPIAIFPPTNDTEVFSGSAVIDTNNTSGFFPDQDDGVVAIYTLNSAEKQVQEISYSRDGGYTFTAFEGNPVIDSTSNQFRDPKVIWYQDHWVMILAYSTAFDIGIFTSYDLKYWTPSSNVSHHGLLGLQYECPNLVQVPMLSNGTATGDDVWGLFISINPGAPLGGSITQYIPGSFDGYTFTPYDSAARLADFAKDNYAGQWFYGTPGEAISLAWASNWQYTAQVPTASEGWRSAMSLPRKNYMTTIDWTGWDLVSLPYDLTPVLSSQLSYDSDFVNKSVIVDYSNSTVGALYFTANFSLPDDAVFGEYASLNFSFSSPKSGENVRGGYMLGGSNPGTAWLDRTDTKAYGPDNPLYTNRFSVTAPKVGKSVWGVIDRSMLEVFIDDGAYSATMLFFAEDAFTNFSIATGDLPEGMGVTIGVWELSSVWQQS